MIHDLASLTITDLWYLVTLPLSLNVPVLIMVAMGDFPHSPILLGMPFLLQMEALIDAPNKKIITKYGIMNN